MKSKLAVAYEAKDSHTIRLTPSTIGKLVSEIPDGKLDEFTKSLSDESIFMTSDRRKLLMIKLAECISTIKEMDNE